MFRFERQLRIENWDQKKLREAHITVCGRDWLGIFTVWALASLGIGEIVWVGRSQESTDSLARWFLADPSPFTGCAIYDYPFDIEYGSELAWIVENSFLNAILCCSESVAEQNFCFELAEKRKGFFLSASTGSGGWFGAQPPPDLSQTNQDPVISMMLAGLIADSVREHLCPLDGGEQPEQGSLMFKKASISSPGKVLLVGAGGVGVYAATLLAEMGHKLHIVDFDHVEETNLNRQGLFSPEDAQNRHSKATAARDALQRLFSRAEVSAEHRFVDYTYEAALNEFGPKAILSAVDNAETRLLLQAFASELGIPIIQGGTGVFSSDCYTQIPDGRSLDEQMYGAMSEAAAKERTRPRHGGCAGDPSYVVPGMLAGAFMVYRLAQLGQKQKPFTPIHWRSGSIPREGKEELRYDISDSKLYE